MNYEIIRIKVTLVEEHRFNYRNLVTGAAATADSNGHPLEVGATLTIEIDPRRKKLVRIVGRQPKPVPTPRPKKPKESSILVNGKPITRLPEDPAVKVGQIRYAKIPFTTNQTAHRDKHRDAKIRPAVVAKVEGDRTSVLPVHGTKTFVARGSGRVLRDWKEAGLTKRSTVSPESIWVDTASLSRLIGELTPEDRRLLRLETR